MSASAAHGVMPRRLRRNLDRRAARVLDRLRGQLLAVSADVGARSHVILVTERTRPTVVARDRLQEGLDVLGAGLDLRDVIAAMATDDRDDGRHYPILIYLDGWLQTAWIDGRILSRGGRA